MSYSSMDFRDATDGNEISGNGKANGKIPALNGSHDVHDHHSDDLLRPEGMAVIETAVHDILLSIGEDPTREGLVKTPNRVARAYNELLEGYTKDLPTILNGALFEVEYGDGEMVIVSNIAYQSMCEHHMLPFTGMAHVGYIPNKRVVGLSKIPRIVDMFARRLQIQERLTNEIASALDEALEPRGVIAVLSGHHMCGSLRGVRKHEVNMTTTALRGEFRHYRELRNEFYSLLDRS